MKRSGPIQRKTPLKRGGPLRRTGGLKRSGRINPVSAKRQAENRERTESKRRLFARSPRCQRCHVRPSEHAHEVKTRARGGSITDLENMRALCHICHREIHDSPEQAHLDGWLVNSWED